MNNKKVDTKNITGVILAGGRAKRMSGQDKGLLTVNGQPMIKLIIEQFAPQVDSLIINANRNIEHYKKYDYPVISDNDASEFHGPLAGMLSALKTAKTEYVLSIPCDSPFIPDNLSQWLLAALIENDTDISVVHDGKRLQPVFALIKTELTGSLQNYINNGDRKIDLWYQQHKTVFVDFSEYSDISLNINTPDELQKLEQKLSGYKKVC